MSQNLVGKTDLLSPVIAKLQSWLNTNLTGISKKHSAFKKVGLLDACANIELNSKSNEGRRTPEGGYK